MNDFAKAQLKKYGWSEGKGLGKHESGITEALRPKLKFDTAGIGHRDKDWNNWWENVFDKAASNITVESQAHGVSISLSKEPTIEDSPVEDLNEKGLKHNYNNFVKTSTLLNGNLVEENNVALAKNQKVQEDVTHVALTDEELFKICGGRTAHKGARHGLTLNGKLKRIAQQEQHLLGIKSSANTSEGIIHDNVKLQDDESEIMINNASTEEVTKVPKNSRRKNKRRINDLTHQLNVLCNVSDADEMNAQALKNVPNAKREEKHIKRKRKKEKSKVSISCDIEGLDKAETKNEQKDVSSSVSQKETEELFPRNIREQLNDCKDSKAFNYVAIGMKKKKKKKKKSQDNQCGTITDDELYGSQTKKFKKSHKSDSDLQRLIKNEGINLSDRKFQAALSGNEVASDLQATEDPSSSVAESVPNTTKKYRKTEAEYLNAKIKKKKQAKLRKKQQNKLANITRSLMAIDLSTEETPRAKSTKGSLKKIIKKLSKSNIIAEKPLKRGKKQAK